MLDQDERIAAILPYPSPLWSFDIMPSKVKSLAQQLASVEAPLPVDVDPEALDGFGGFDGFDGEHDSEADSDSDSEKEKEKKDRTRAHYADVGYV